MSTREARIMNIRQFRSEMPLDENVIVLSRGIIKGHWTAGTAGIDPGTLAQVMGLRETLETLETRVPTNTDGLAPGPVTGVGPAFGSPSPAPKPKPKR